MDDRGIGGESKEPAVLENVSPASTNRGATAVADADLEGKVNISLV